MNWGWRIVDWIESIFRKIQKLNESISFKVGYFGFSERWLISLAGCLTVSLVLMYSHLSWSPSSLLVSSPALCSFPSVLRRCSGDFRELFVRQILTLLVATCKEIFDQSSYFKKLQDKLWEEKREICKNWQFPERLEMPSSKNKNPTFIHHSTPSWSGILRPLKIQNFIRALKSLQGNWT